MGTPARQLSIAELRRGAAVGLAGLELGLDLVPGVVLADVLATREDVWRPQGHVLVRVWGGKGTRVWAAVQRSTHAAGLQVSVEVHRAGWWARARAWWRWQAWRLGRALERRGAR